MKKYLPSLTLLGIWALIILGFNIRLGGKFASPETVELVLRQGTIVGFGAIGMTLVIISGAIDLSAGSLIALVTVVIALALRGGQPPVAAALIGVVTGFIAGVINGQLVAKLKLGAFITTLCTLLIFRGVATGLANEQKVNAEITWLTQLASSPTASWQVFAPGTWLMILWAMLASFILAKTVFGRQVVASGSNERAAFLAGISVERVRILAYAFCGLSVGLAGLMQFSRLTTGDPTVAKGLELDMIASVVIGGGSLLGGEGRVFGTIMGVLILATLRAGNSQIGLPNYVQDIVTGVIILIAVAFDRWRAGHRQEAN